MGQHKSRPSVKLADSKKLFEAIPAGWRTRLSVVAVHLARASPSSTVRSHCVNEPGLVIVLSSNYISKLDSQWTKMSPCADLMSPAFLPLCRCASTSGDRLGVEHDRSKLSLRGNFPGRVREIRQRASKSQPVDSCRCHCRFPLRLFTSWGKYSGVSRLRGGDCPHTMTQ